MAVQCLHCTHFQLNGSHLAKFFFGRCKCETGVMFQAKTVSAGFTRNCSAFERVSDEEKATREEWMKEQRR